MKRKIMITIKVFLSGFAILLLYLYIYMFIFGSTIVSPSSVSIQNIKVSDNIVTIEGNDVRDSALAYARYSAKVDGEKLYIKLRYSLVSKFNKSSEFKLIYDYKNKSIKQIFIIGDNYNDEKLVWSK